MATKKEPQKSFYYMKIPALELGNLLNGQLSLAAARLGGETGPKVYETFMRLLAAGTQSGGVFTGTAGITAEELVTSHMGMASSPETARKIISTLCDVGILDRAQDGTDEILLVPLVSWLGKPATDDSRRHTASDDKRIADNASRLPKGRFESLMNNVVLLQTAKGA